PALSSLLFISVLLHPPTSPLSPYTTLFRSQLNQLIQQLDGLDIIVLNAGISASPEASARETDLEVIAVNITGLANLAAHSFSYFEEKGHGQLVGVSSIASLFAWGKSASYNASKAFVNRYLQGYHQKANHSA